MLFIFRYLCTKILPNIRTNLVSSKPVCTFRKRYFGGITILFTVGRGAPTSALPVGASSSQDPLRLNAVHINNEIFNCLLAVSHAKSLDEVLSTSIAGFIYVQSVDMEGGTGTVTYLSPGPGKLPGRFLLMGSIEILNFS